MTQSFELLRRYSSQDNVKLRDVAEYVVEHGGLPESGLSEGGAKEDAGAYQADIDRSGEET